ncbi:YebC/PmpR family DNA-binding transcriptional regulator [Patescibacteria group bacterium]|nr:YebC/PmpR family DNA-binding transcriptional regulator [Patescibacteria group bacterium]
MSGHSKWSTIKRQKGATDQKRGNLFTKLGNNIVVAARQGGGDPEMNFQLRLAIDRAKASNFPKENIDRAIKKGTGELAGEELKEMVFEGYGPAGVAMIIEVLSSNRNRATSTIRNILAKYGGKLGELGSVNWNFVRQGVMGISAAVDKEKVELAAIEAGVEDVSEEPEGIIVFTEPGRLETVKNKLEQQGIIIDYAQIAMVAANKTSINDKEKSSFHKLEQELLDSDEVNNVYSNADL